MLVIWVAYGFVRRRTSDSLRTSVTAIPRTRRAILSAVMLFGGAAALLAGLYAVSAFGWMTKTGLTIGGFVLVTLVGLLFVHMQVQAAAMMVSIALESVTTASSEASITQTPKESSNES